MLKTQSTNLTKQQLESYLYNIRNTLCLYDYKKIDNVIFFNNDVVYEYLCNITLNNSYMTVGDALDTIENFMPVFLRIDDNMDTIEISRRQEGDDGGLQKKRGNMMFLQLLTQMKTKSELEDFVTVLWYR